MRKCGTELLQTNHLISLHRGPEWTHGWCHSVGNQMVEVTKSNSSRNTNNMKIAVENAYICGKKYGTCTLC